MVARNKTISTRIKPRIWNLLGERTRRNFLLQAAAGQIPGVATWHVFAYDDNIGNTLKVIQPFVQDLQYITNPTAVTVYCNSLNDGYGSVGAWILRLVGLDQNYTIQTEDVILKPQTTLYSMGDYIRVLSAYVLKSGSRNGAVGNIVIKYRSGEDFTIITTPYNVTTAGSFTVPANSNAYIYNWKFGMGAPKEVLFAVRVTSPDQENPNWIFLDSTYIYGGEHERQYPMPFMLTEKTDVELCAQILADTNSYVSASMDLLLIDKEYDWENILRAEERGGIEKVE